MKDALATAQVETEKSQDQSALLPKMHNMLEGHLYEGFGKVQYDCMEKVEARPEMVVADRNTLGNIRFMDSERAEKFFERARCSRYSFTQTLYRS